MDEYRFGNGEIEAVLATDAETRYRYFIKRTADWEQVWSLRNADAEPTPIPLESFMERWLPGLAGDERLVCVLPGVDGRGPVVQPVTLKDDIQDELDRLE